MARKISNLPASNTRLYLVEFYINFTGYKYTIEFVLRLRKERIKH